MFPRQVNVQTEESPIIQIAGKYGYCDLIGQTDNGLMALAFRDGLSSAIVNYLVDSDSGILKL